MLQINCWWPRRPLWLAEDEWAVEAWEHMTFGGVVVANRPDLGNNTCPPYYEPFVDEYEPLRTFVRVDGERVQATPIEIAGDWKLRGL